MKSFVIYETVIILLKNNNHQTLKLSVLSEITERRGLRWE